MSHWAESFRRQRVLVLGDVMLDRTLHGDADRLSPEAPVPVMRVAGHRDTPGGAANVAMNLAALGATPILLGVTGDDEAGRCLRSVLETASVDTGRLAYDGDRRTTRKVRAVVRGQQMLRMDTEDTAPLHPDVEGTLRRAVDRLLPGVSAVVLADYDKGVLTDSLVDHVKAAALARGLPIVGDAKGNPQAYAQVTVLKMNEREIRAAYRYEFEMMVRASLRVPYLLVTLGAAGMRLVTGGRDQTFPALARGVSDVTGAGDTVTAWLAAGLAAGLPIEETITLANRAAGIVVGKPGVATVTPQEVEAEP